MTIEIRLLGPGDETALQNVAPDVFDNPLDLGLSAEFLRDGHHYLAIALDRALVVGFASAIAYVHPDKPLELWINEVGVAASHRRQGIGKQLVLAVLAAGRAAGCREGWVLSERSNSAAMRLYESSGAVRDSGESVLYSFGLES